MCFGRWVVMFQPILNWMILICATQNGWLSLCNRQKPYLRQMFPVVVLDCAFPPKKQFFRQVISSWRHKCRAHWQSNCPLVVTARKTAFRLSNWLSFWCEFILHATKKTLVWLRWSHLRPLLYSAKPPTFLQQTADSYRYWTKCTLSFPCSTSPFCSCNMWIWVMRPGECCHWNALEPVWHLKWIPCGESFPCFQILMHSPAFVGKIWGQCWHGFLAPELLQKLGENNF